MKYYFYWTVGALVTLAIGLSWNDLFAPPEKERPIEPVSFLLMPQQHVMVYDVGGSGRSARFELVGMKPTMVPSPIMGVRPKPAVSGDVYVFKGRALQLRNGSPDKVTVQVAGTFTKIVIVEVPEGIPVFFGKKGDPPSKKK